jgi:hypothetical protein
MAGTEILVACTGMMALFMACFLIGYQYLKKYKNENESFSRAHVEDAMRIKARQYRNKD